jgi:DNA repair exonuclease SbcCD ATPase subunit
MAIRYIELEAENSLSYKHLKVPLANQGLVLLQGPNGSGKSSIPNLINYAQYRNTPQKQTQREMINIHEKNNLWICLKTEIDGVEWVFEHFNKHDQEGSKIKITKAGKLISAHMKKSEAELFVVNLVPDRTTFLSTVYLSQKHNHVLVSGSPKEKERYVMWLFNLSRLEDLSKEARNLKKESQSHLADEKRLSDEIDDAKAKLAQLPTELQVKSRGRKLFKRMKELKAESPVLEGRLSKLSSTLGKVETREELLNSLGELDIGSAPTPTQVKEARVKADSLAQKLANLKNKLQAARKAEQIKSELEQYKESRPLTEIKGEVEKYQAEKTLLLGATLRNAEKAHSLRIKLNKIPVPKKSFEEYENAVEEISGASRKVERKVSALHSQLKNGICPTCKQPWKLSHEEHGTLKSQLDELRAKLDQLNREKHVAKKRLDNCSQYENIKDKLKGLPSKDPQQVELEIRTTISRLKELNHELSLAEKKKDLQHVVDAAPAEPVNQIVDNLRSTKKELEAARKEHSKLSKAKQILDQVAALPPDNLEDLQSSIKETRLALEQIRRELIKSQQELTDLKAKKRDIHRLQKEVKDKEALHLETRKHRRDSEVLDSLSKGFSFIMRKKERELLKKLTDKIPNFAKSLFGRDTSWLTAELCKDPEGIDLKLSSKGQQIPVRGISPGQHAKLGLSSLFALREVYSPQSNLLVMDEPLAGVDSRGITGFSDIVMQVKKNVETLILISHDPDIKGMKFDRVWTAKINDGVSTLDL